MLVVDDDRAICELMREALDRHDLSVECVGSDRAAYSRISSMPTISALIVDVNLGRGTTGYDVARFARQAIPDLPVYYVSGEVDAHSYSAFGVPGSEFIEKPFAPSELAAMVMARLRPTAAAHLG